MARTAQEILGLFETTPERTAQNVLGAVRIGGQQQVFTLGTGGRAIETPEQLLTAGFREEEVLEVTAEEAAQLGIATQFTGITAPVAPAQPTPTDAKPPTPTAPDQPKGEFIQVAGTTQKFQKLPGGGLRGFGTEEEFERAGGVFGQETPVSGVEFRTIAEAAGVSEKDITSIVGAREEGTATAQDIQKVTGRKTAVESLLEDEQAVNEALGFAEEEEDVREAREDISEFFTKRKSFETLLNEEFKRRGIEVSTTLLNDLNARILTQQKSLRDLPEDIQKSLEDVGVTQAQLNRAVAKEIQKPIEVLRDLLEERNALASEINTAINFAQIFADSRFEDQAVQLMALQFNLESEKGDLFVLEQEKKDLLKLIIDEQKQVLSLALQNPDANIDVVEDGIQEALDKVRQLPGELLSRADAEALGLPFGISVREAAELGIVPVGEQFSDPFFLPGVGTVQQNLLTGDINVLRAIPAPVTPRGPTASQFQAAQFAGRIVQATNILDALEPGILQLSATELKIQRALPNVLKSETIRSLEQAERNFVNALLRRESGAAIAPSEFASAEKQYFIRPGESRALRDQKRANRELVEIALINESGEAFTQLQQSLIESVRPETIVPQTQEVTAVEERAKETRVDLSNNLFFQAFNELTK